MSGEHVETLRVAYEAWNRGDLDALRDIYAPNVVAHVLADSYHSELVAERFIDHGESVVVPTIWRGTLHDSASVIEQRVVAVYIFRGKQVVRIEYFEHLDQALERIGGPES